jgi:hypothetical protein
MSTDPSCNAEAVERARIDATFRNGSLTAIGVVVGFSLGFLSRWAGIPGEWSGTDLIAVGAITVGIGLQIKALADMLSPASLVLTRYRRAIRFFLAGLILVAAGVLAAIFADVLGYGANVLRGQSIQPQGLQTYRAAKLEPLSSS